MKSRYVLLVVLALLLVASVQADWLTGWDYRKSVHINGSSSGDVTNYQVMIGVYNTTGTDNATSVFLGTNAADDTWFSDIRFTGSDGTTLIDIWNETYYSDHADVWIECPSIDDSTGWDGYIYYGKSGASEVWSGVDTFPLLFDHFEGESIDIGKWISGGKGVTISDSTASINTVGGYGSLRSVQSYPDNRTMKLNGDIGYTTATYYGFYSGGTNYALFYPAGTQYAARTTSPAVSTNLGNSYTGERLWEIIRNSTTSVDYFVDNTEVASHSTTPLDTFQIRFYAATGGYLVVDWVFVRNYTYPEPAISTFWAEEIAPVTAAFSGTPTTGGTPLTVAFSDASTTEAGTVNTWSWVFGDGTISTSQNPSHTYTTSGTYTVNLTVTNSLGSTDLESKTDYITVTIPGTPTADFSGTPTSGVQPLEVQFTDESTGSPTAWNWSFGDGEYSTWQHPIHTYSAAGTYTVILNASNSFGYDTHSIVDYITVTEPTVTSTGTIPPTPGDMTVENGGISPFGLVVMMLTTTGMVVYSFADNENRNYLHIVSAGISMLLAFVAGVVLMTGMVTADVIVTSESVTVNESVYGTYAVEHVAITDTAVGWFWIFVGVVMLIITILGTIEALSESHREVS